MRLDGQEESENVEDRRGAFGGGGGFGGGFGGLPIHLSFGSIVLILILSLVFHVNPLRLLGLVGGGGPAGGPAPSAVQQPADPRDDELRHFSAVIFRDTEKVWDDVFKSMGRTYPKPTLVLYSGQVNSACGMAESAVGPFYCGGDQRVYLDLSFFREMQDQLHSPGDFARAYVIAHEVGHHVQRVLGYADLADRNPGNHETSVRMELQADYFAGVWAAKAEQKFNFLDNGDLESAIHCAQQIGDDTLQKQATGTVRPEKFTHGTSAQRVKWFKKGYDTASVDGAAALFELPYNRL